MCRNVAGSLRGSERIWHAGRETERETVRQKDRQMEIDRQTD